MVVFGAAPTRRILATNLRWVAAAAAGSTKNNRTRTVISVKYQDFTREHWPIRYQYIRFHERVPREVILERWDAITPPPTHK